MNPHTILTDLWAHQITLRLAPDSVNLVVPAGRLSPEQRALVLDHKPELIQYLDDVHLTTMALLRAADRACDHHGVDESARKEMREQCLNTPVHQRSNLLDHLRQTYGAKL